MATRLEATGASHLRQARKARMYLIPEDYLTPSKKGNLLVLLEDFGLVDDGCARGKAGGLRW